MTAGVRFHAILLAVGVCFAAIGLPVGIAGAVFYQYWIAPARRLADAAWLNTASPAELRETAHHALRGGRGHHDAFLILAEHGDAESVPLLVDALQLFPGAGEAVSCSKAHCLDALRRITGHDAGSRHEDWARWWGTVGSRMPPGSFTAGPSSSRRCATTRTAPTTAPQT